MSFTPDLISRRRLSLAEIDAAVSARFRSHARLGKFATCLLQPSSRDVFGRHVGGWSTTVIGRFYNGRDHSTVCHGIQRIEALRESGPGVDALVSDLKRELQRPENLFDAEVNPEGQGPSVNLSQRDLEELADMLATRVCERIEKIISHHKEGAL